MHEQKLRLIKEIAKQIFIGLWLFCLSLNVQAQTNTTAGIYFQAIARDKADNPANNRKIFIKTTILSSNVNAVPLFVEEHETSTDKTGVFNIAIGNGKFISGTANKIENIDWSVIGHQLNLKIAIRPIAPSFEWDYHTEWIDLGTTPFGIVPYAMHVIGGNGTIDPSLLNGKVNIADTTAMLIPYAKMASVMSANLISTKLNEKLNLVDSTVIFVTPTQWASKIVDTIYLSNRINLKEDIANKAIDISNLTAYNDTQYPTVKAIKDYVDAAVVAGAPDAAINTKGILKLAGDLSGTAAAPIIARSAITTNKILDASVTDAKIASGINASKVGLSNVTNNAQLYNFNGLTAQIQNFASPGTTGIAPNWSSAGNIHTLNIPLASASSVTAGLLSKSDFDQFVSAYANNINSITTVGTNGVAALSGQNLNIPSYTLIGLAGNLNANTVFAGPVSGGMGAASFRSLVSADIPNNAANTSGNAATASKLSAGKNINGISFDGSADILINSTTTNALSFSNDGLGVAAGGSFNGATAKIVSYNTIAAAPAIGSTSITTVGSISTGTWAASVIDANYGGAGTNNGILKANGTGLVSTAVVGTDYLIPFSSQIAKHFYAAPTAAKGNPSFRAIIAADIPILNQNTTGNSATATVLENARLINGVSFDGSTDISIPTNTSNAITFNNGGSGALSSATFNGATAKTISYNTIGAAPAAGNTSITTVGIISAGTWEANVIDASHGGAGTINGILKADGTGLVGSAIAGTDFQSPLSFTSPLVKTINTVSIPQSTGSVNGYLTAADWTSFNNKINTSQRGANDGVASLDANGKIPTAQIPAISFSSGYVVISESAMLGLSAAVIGSIAIRTDNSKNYVLSGLPATTLSNWLELLMPASVYSVNGQSTGSIVLTSSDINEGSNLYFTAARVKSLLSATSPMAYSSSTGVISIPAATNSAAGYLTATDWNTFNNKLGIFSNQTANTIFAGPITGISASPSFRTIVANDIPTLNQNTTGNAATATKWAATKNINGIAFDGSADITIAASLSNAINFNSGGTGAISPISFDGLTSKTISYNSIGAAPAAGSSSITSVGTIASGVWAGTVIDASHGGAGTVNGILKADGSGNLSSATAGTDYQTPFGSQTSRYFYAAPNASNGSPIFRSILSTDIPTLNQNTTGNAATATKFAASKNINGIAFDGSADITIASNMSNEITFDNTGSGVLSGGTFNGSTAKTISYNTIGAAPSIGSSSIITLGTISAGTWSASIIDASHGGAGTINGILKANGSGLVSAASAGTDFENALTFSAPLSRTSNTISIGSATTSSNGYLTSADWNIFNGKQATIVAGTGVSISGATTITIGQAVATTSSPLFAGITLSGLNVSGIVTNTASGVLNTTATTGTGNIVRATSPTLVTPVLGDASATSITATSISAGAISASADISAKRFKLTMPSAITAAATTTIDLSTGNVFTINVGLNITALTLNNPVVGTYLIKLVQTGAGNWNLTFPTAWKWAGGVVPDITPTTGKLDIVTLIYDGTNYYTTIVQNF